MRSDGRNIARLAALLGLVGSVACGHPYAVDRAYGGDVVNGRFIGPESYASFLRGAIAEAEHHPDEAVRAYLEAASEDGASPETWTRIAHIECTQMQGAAPKGRQAADRALSIDDDYAPGWEAKAECAAAVGDASGQQAAASRASAIDPQGDGAGVVLARSDSAGKASSREALVALTLTAHDPPVAWDALAAWAEAHGDIALWTRALVELVRAAPERREGVARSAEALAGIGAVEEARAVAAAVVEVTEEPLRSSLALAALLAVDDAIAHGAVDTVRHRATRARVTLEEAAARALLAGHRELAREIAGPIADADPKACNAKAILAIAAANQELLASSSTRCEATASASAWVVVCDALSRRGPAPAQCTSLGTRHPSALVAGDDLAVRPAAALAARGSLDASALPPDGALELAVFRGGPAPAVIDRLDARHRYLALALGQPGAPSVAGLAGRLHAVDAADPLVVAADALVQLASGAPVTREAPRTLLERYPGDLLLATIALRLAEKAGDADVARRARESLTALGPTPPRM